MQLDQLLDPDLLAEMLAGSFVSRQVHPTLPLAILNYTAKAQYSKTWNAVTRQCRGLIYNSDTNEIVARPFPKFFNLGEHADSDIPALPFEVFEKMDGSLGILYVTPSGGRAIATRGSFTSEQAIHATAVYNARYRDEHEVRPGDTWLFEIIYPTNRIVVDYGAKDDLVLLDIIDNETGTSMLKLSGHRWLGPRARRYDGLDSLEKLLAAEQESNFEGYVLRFSDGMRIKVKNDEYVRLHRILTGVSSKTIWETLSTTGDLREILDRVPDEFYQWVQTTADALKLEFWRILQDSGAAFDMVANGVQLRVAGEGHEGGVGSRLFRKLFAEAAVMTDYPDILFRMLDERPFDELIWKRIKPDYERPFASISEAVA